MPRPVAEPLLSPVGASRPVSPEPGLSSSEEGQQQDAAVVMPLPPVSPSSARAPSTPPVRSTVAEAVAAARSSEARLGAEPPWEARAEEHMSRWMRWQLDALGFGRRSARPVQGRCVLWLHLLRAALAATALGLWGVALTGGRNLSVAGGISLWLAGRISCRRH